MWIPKIENAHGPIYLAIADALEVLQSVGHENSELTMLHVGKDAPNVHLPDDFPWKHTTVMAQGNAVDQILDQAGSLEADLLLMVTAGHQGFLDMIRGSTTERVLRHAPCPVLAIPGAEDRRA